MKAKVQRWIPVIGTLLTVLLVDSLTQYGLPFTLAVSFVFIAMSGYLGGLWPAVGAAAIVAIYTFYNDSEFLRAMVIALAANLIAILVGIQKDSLIRYGTAGTVLDKLREIDIELKGLLSHWDDLSNSSRHIIVQTIHHKFTKIFTMAQGWHELAKEHKKLVDDETTKPD